ncbi:p24 [Sucra jujuba nucleopolyhedrovirus]|uniref:p24 n=1 Tax=Sucra jujuba nucleopolyhedrovirus TaxID=1563660 RepID=A0A097P939_9ABAC|nr:p24 [Sucra jujuba nucleopolyhedrovirus]AIU41347.1 p24 [Sucra jujuba nucleopolyhedrovirus]
MKMAMTTTALSNQTSLETVSGSNSNISNTKNHLSEEHGQQHFQYDDECIEVVIIENNEDDRDGYVELSAATRLVSPIVTIRGFNKAVMWTNVHPSHKLTRNSKNYVHAFALCKYLSAYNLSNKRHPPQMFVLKRLISDLIMGGQSQMIDPISDIKNQLCTLQECLSANVTGGNLSNGVNNSAMVTGMQQIYQPTTVNNMSVSEWSETFRDMLRHEHVTLLANITSALDTIKSMQLDFTNKLAFSNDTMLDSFKSIKDIIIRKK